MTNENDHPTQDEHFNGLEEELHSDEANSEDWEEESEYDEPWDGFMTDAEADADVLDSAGWGTDEDYGYFGGDEY